MERKARYMIGALIAIIIAIAVIGYAYISVYRPPAELKRITIGTAAIGGGWYPIGVGVSQVINRYIPGVSAVAESTGGSIENIRLVSEGKVSMAWGNNPIVMLALKGEKPYEKPIKNIMALFVIGEKDTYHNIVTLEGSGINSIKDLKGKRVSIGSMGSAANYIALWLFKLHGVLPEELKITYLGWEDAMTALKDGRIDVAYVMSAIPRAPSIYELATTHKIKLIPVDPEVVTRAIREEGVPFALTYIKAGTYPGVNVDVPCIASGSVALVRPDFPEDLAYKIVKAVNEHLDEVDRIAPGFKGTFKLITSPDFYLPVHPGAIKYAKELGVWKE